MIELQTLDSVLSFSIRFNDHFLFTPSLGRKSKFFHLYQHFSNIWSRDHFIVLKIIENLKVLF